MIRVRKAVIPILIGVLLLSNLLAYAETITIEFETASNYKGDFIRAMVSAGDGTMYLVNHEFASTHGDTLDAFKYGMTMSPPRSNSAIVTKASTYTSIPTSGLIAGIYDVYYVNTAGEIICSKMSSVTIHDYDIDSSYHLKSLQVMGKDLPDFNPNKFNYLLELSQTDYDSLGTIVNEIVAVPADSTGTTYVIEGTTPKNARVQVFVLPDFGPLPYTISAVLAEEGTKEPVIDDPNSNDSDTSADGPILQINRSMGATLTQGLSDEELVTKTASLIDEMNGIIQETEDSAAAEQAFEGLSTALGTLSKVIGQLENKEQVIENIAKLTNNTRHLVLTIENNDKITDLTAKYFTNMEQVVNQISPKEYQTKNLKNNVFKLGNQAVKKTGILKTDSEDITVKNGKASINFDSAKVLDHVDKANVSFGKINGAMKKLLGANDPRNIEHQVTLDVTMPDGADEVSSNLDKALLESISAKGHKQIALNVDNLALTFSKDVLKPDETSLNINTAFEDNSNISPPAGVNPVRDATIADITMASENEGKSKFNQPIELEFNLKELGLENLSESYLNNLSIYVQNPETFVWEVVGGNYDPVTKTIKVYRMGLSKYTVMQSQKSFSDVDNSWAKDEINELLGKGIVDETSTFKPKSQVTREDFTTWVAKSYGLSKGDLEVPFEDVTKDHPHYAQISTAYEQGIISGKSAQSFDPKGYITREEMSTIVSNALTKYDENTVSGQLVSNINKYQDEGEIADWAKNTVALVDELGIMRGDDITFRPKDNVTKEEAAAIVKRIYN